MRKLVVTLPAVFPRVVCELCDSLFRSFRKSIARTLGVLVEVPPQVILNFNLK